MCGIAGIIDINNQPIQPHLLVAMNQALAHRGPDDEGYALIDRARSQCRTYAGHFSSEGIKASLPILPSNDLFPGASIGLSQRRFSIIDLSVNGHQPFFDKERSCCLVFNGEIYNYLEVRDQLVAHGLSFSTQSDTEVFVEAYKYWGTDCFAKLNGFWAIALYDFRKRQLIVGRDRLGKKPLYWARDNTRFYFASEIKALLQIPNLRQRRKVNEESICQWLVYGRKDLDFTTCFEGIYSVPSASWGVIAEGFPDNVRTFWSVPQQRMAEKDISTTEAARGVRELLQDAVKLRLRADVPLSVELSGGLDSSTLVALAAQVHPGKITTYTVRFPDKGCNEEPYARSVARRYDTNYRVLESPTTNFWSQIRPFTYLEEEPYHSPNLQTNQVVWAQMRAMGTKVSLNGAGGDENFAGYSQYYVPAQMQNLMEGRVARYLDNAVRYSQGRTNILGLTRPVIALAREFGQRMMSRRQGSKEKAVPYFKGKPCHQASFRSGRLSQVLYDDMTNTLMPYWLRSGDRGYMGVPLEVRAPFLDFRVVEFAFRLPLTYLFRHGWHKWILRKAMEDILPGDVVWRRQKLGFPFPFDRFYAENEAIIGLILENSHNPYIDFSQKRRFHRDWKVLSFILWYEMFINENDLLFEKIEAKARQMGPIEEYGYAPQFLNATGRAG
jgi:asparagine synthase (glutamine-hydrolysing)